MKVDGRLRKKQDIVRKVNSMLRKRHHTKFPNCVGKFPDDSCKNSTKEKPGEDCLKCPYY